MGCCGQKRLAMVSAGTPADTPTRGGGAAYQSSFLVGTPRRSQPASSDVELTYVATGLFSARGGRTGRLYSCEGAGATLGVDPGDVEGLMRTRLFSRQARTGPW